MGRPFGDIVGNIVKLNITFFLSKRLDEGTLCLKKRHQGLHRRYSPGSTRTWQPNL